MAKRTTDSKIVPKCANCCLPDYDDNSDVLRLLPVEFRVDRERPRTEVWVTEWRDEA